MMHLAFPGAEPHAGAGEAELVALTDQNLALAERRPARAPFPQPATMTAVAKYRAAHHVAAPQVPASLLDASRPAPA